MREVFFLIKKLKKYKYFFLQILEKKSIRVKNLCIILIDFLKLVLFAFNHTCPFNPVIKLHPDEDVHFISDATKYDLDWRSVHNTPFLPKGKRPKR